MDRFKNKYRDEYGDLINQRNAVADKLSDKITGWYCALMTEGIDHALEIGLKLHRTSNTDNTYRNIIGKERWDPLYRKRIDYLNEEKVYREFLPGEEEWRVFQEQDTLREPYLGKL